MNKGRLWKPSMNSRWISVFPVGSCIPVLSWYPVPPILPLPSCSLPLYQRFHSSWFQFLVVILGPVILKGSFQSLSTPQLSIGHSDTRVGWAGAQHVPLGVNNPVLRAQFSASRVTANVRWCRPPFIMSRKQSGGEGQVPDIHPGGTD